MVDVLHRKLGADAEALHPRSPDAENAPSCQALLRIGATREGILRQYMSSPHKGARDIALFSIIDREWPDIKARLELRLYRRNTHST